MLGSIGQQRSADPWHLLASQFSLLDKFQGNERPCLKKKMVNSALGTKCTQG